MALDPTIPLGVQPMGGGAQANPLAMISQWAQLQNAMNQNKLFQQTFAARQRAGQILSSAPDMETGLASLMQDPLTAPFAGETINAVRQSQLTLAQTQGMIQEQAESGLDGFFKSLPGVLADPSEDTWNNLLQSRLATLSPQVQARVSPAIDSMKKSLLSGLPEDPAQRQAVFTQRLTGLTLAGGFSPEGMKQLMGTPGTVDVGGGIQPTVERPIQLGGETVPVGQAFPKSLPPTITQGPGGVPFGIGGGVNPLVPGMGQGGSAGAGPSGNPLMPSQPSLSGQVQVSPLAPPAGVQEAELNPLQSRAVPPAGKIGDSAGPAGSADDGPLSYTGKPLFEGIGQTPSVGTSNVIPGLRMLSPTQQRSAEKQIDQFEGDDLQRYDSMVASIGQLDRMDADMRELAKSGGKFLQTGAFGGTRLEIAKSINLMGDQLGLWDSTKPQSAENNPYFDPKAIASAEDFRKEATRAGMALLNQTLGAQREAASVIFSTIQAVPGLDNTLQGNRLVSASLRAAAQRVLDQRVFQEEWLKRNQGDLTGSLTAFNKAHPGRDYLEQALNSVGMTEGGFASPEAIRQAKEGGYLTEQEAYDILLDQFPDMFRARRR